MREQQVYFQVLGYAFWYLVFKLNVGEVAGQHFEQFVQVGHMLVNRYGRSHYDNLNCVSF